MEGGGWDEVEGGGVGRECREGRGGICMEG